MIVNLFKPYPAQKSFIDKYADSEHMFGVLVSPRGSGKTLLAINIALYWVLKRNNSKLGYITPTYALGKQVFEIITSKTHQLITSSNKAELSINFVNGSSLKFLSADRADSVRGFRFEYLIIDEAAYVKKDAIESAILPTLNPNGIKCLLISTPRSKNHFYEYYVRGQNDDKDIISHRITLEECPFVSQELVEEAKKSLPAEVFAAEYNAEFTEAENDVFTNFAKNCIIDGWENPHRGAKYYFGIDTGLSSDYSCLTILDETGRVAFIDHVNNLPLEQIAERFTKHLKRYNVATGYIESNGIGAGMFELVKKHIREANAFYTSQDNKMKAIRQLLSDIENTNIFLPTRDLFSTLYDEMSSYTYKYSANGKISFTHPNGLHDDSLDSLWLANHARHELKNTGASKIYVGRSSVNGLYR